MSRDGMGNDRVAGAMDKSPWNGDDNVGWLGCVGFGEAHCL